MEAEDRRSTFGVERAAAAQLAGRVMRGLQVPTVSCSIALEDGESAHADVVAYGWRFHGVDVMYESPQIVGFAHPILQAPAALARGRARRNAERLASPQWRSLGHLRIIATDRRMLVLYAGEWASVWYVGITELRPFLDEDRIEMLFDEDPPYALAGPWVPYLAVVIATCLADLVGIDRLRSTLALAS